MSVLNSTAAASIDVYEEWLQPPATLIRRAATNAFLSITGVSINAIVLYGTARINRPSWTPNGLLMANHWISNILVCFVIIDKMIRYLTKPFFHLVYCKLRAYLLYVSIGSTVLSLTLITFHRFFKVVFPYRTSLGFSTIRRTLLLIGGQWMFNLGIVLLPLTGAMGNLGFETRNQNCRSIVDSDRSMHSLFIVIYTFGTTLIHAVCYIKIFVKVRQQNRAVATSTGNTTIPAPLRNRGILSSDPRNTHLKVPGNNVLPLSDPSNSGSTSTSDGIASAAVNAIPTITNPGDELTPATMASSSTNSAPSHVPTLSPWRKREIRVAFMSFGFVLTYSLCFVPFGVTSTMKILNHPVHHLTADMLWAFVVINPMLYMYGDKRIKDTLKEKLNGCCQLACVQRVTDLVRRGTQE